MQAQQRFLGGIVRREWPVSGKGEYVVGTEHVEMRIAGERRQRAAQGRGMRVGRWTTRRGGEVVVHVSMVLIAARRHAAVDHDLGSGDETRLVGGEEQGRIGGVAAVAHEAERNADTRCASSALTSPPVR